METKASHRLEQKIIELERQLEEAHDAIEAIRTGQIDALVVTDHNVHTLYTLKSADQAYRGFIERMAEGAVSLNADGVIVYSNTMFASMADCPLTKVLGAPFLGFVADEDKNSFLDLFQRGWKEDVKREISLLAAGTRVRVQLSVNALAGAGDSSLNIIVTNLTAQKKTEETLREKNEQLRILNEALAKSNHDLQQFASVASHDLQEPLRKIQVFSQFLKERGGGELSDGSQKYVEKIISASNRMKTLIVDILTYSRLSADDSNLEVVSIRDLCEEILDDFDLQITEKNAQVHIGDLPSLEANRGQLRQVFNNLISNALKFSGQQAPPYIVIEAKPLEAQKLGLSLANESNYCRISVQDNGIGFDERHAASIFNLFEKLHPKSSFEGSGIGLAIAKKIIEKHHGIITARSKLGQGSEFNIILPLKRAFYNGS
jgi:signal transduction histidine kinase